LQCRQGSEKELGGWLPSIQKDGDVFDVSIMALGKETQLQGITPQPVGYLSKE
jgi:hypothetical protein